MASILPLPPGVVGEVVGRSHGDLGRVRELVGQYPTAVNAAFDWGNGDFETALGAAAHSGRRDIAEFLLSKGARMDVFAAAMLGKLSIVKAMVADDGAVAGSAGPHGIPLIEHAKKGGSAEVVAYLEGILYPERAAQRRMREEKRGAVAARVVVSKVGKKVNGVKKVSKKVRAR
jgi:hypothetical protein